MEFETLKRRYIKLVKDYNKLVIKYNEIVNVIKELKSEELSMVSLKKEMK